MKWINFSHLGKMPFTQEKADYLQESFTEVLSAIAKLCGDKTIICGVEELVPGTITDGWISFNGEPVEFRGGAISTDVVIDTDITQFTYKDASVHNVYHTKFATLGPAGAFPFSDLKRLQALIDFSLPGEIKSFICDAAYIAANFPAGLGIGKHLGWAIADGNNGTEDMGGFVPIGYKATEADYDEPGKTGGQDDFIVDKENIQAFDITKSGSAGTGGVGYPVNGGDTADGSLTWTVGVASPTPIDNRMKFKVLLLIQKLP